MTACRLACCVLLLTTFAACTPGSRDVPADTSSAAHAHAAAALDSLFIAAHQAGQFDGTVLVAAEDSVIYAGAFGYADHAAQIPNTLDTRYRIASITKSFTAALVLRLAADGRLRLDDPLSRYVTAYPRIYGDRITLHQLLTNTAGVPHYEGLGSVGLTVDAFRPLRFTPEAYARFIGQMELVTEPGMAFHYSSFGYDLLGAVVEAASGMSYAEALAAYVTGPLGMTATGYAPAGLDVEGKPVEQLAKGYEPSEGGTVVLAPFRDLTNAYAAGGLYASAPDLHRWALALYDDAFLPPPYGRLMRTNHLVGIDEGVGYGYGLAVQQGGPDDPHAMGDFGLAVPYVVHGGSLDGFRSLLISAEGGAYVVVILSNAGAAVDERVLGQAVATVINRHLIGHSNRAAP